MQLSRTLFSAETNWKTKISINNKYKWTEKITPKDILSYQRQENADSLKKPASYLHNASFTWKNTLYCIVLGGNFMVYSIYSSFIKIITSSKFYYFLHIHHQPSIVYIHVCHHKCTTSEAEITAKADISSSCSFPDWQGTSYSPSIFM